MSEERYIKAPCCECNGRVSLPLDAIGVDFNCPHCGGGLQMLLKHVCEHCNGKLSFDENPDAIGTEIECGHCHNQTRLSPSTFSTEVTGADSAPSEPEDLEEVYEEDVDAEPEEEKPKRGGPPRPRASRRGAGPPRPRQKKASKNKSTSGGEPPAKMGRRLPGSGSDNSSAENVPPNPELKSPMKHSRAAPTRTSKIESVDEARAPSPRRTGTTSPDLFDPERSAAPPANVASPIEGDTSNDSPPATPSAPAAAPSAPAAVERRIAGRKIAGETPSDKSEETPKLNRPVPSDQEKNITSEETTERKEMYKKIAVTAAGVALIWALVYIVLPSAVEIFSPVKAKKIREYTRFQFGGAERHDISQDFTIDHDATAITDMNDPNGWRHVIGSIQNISSNPYDQVEVKIELYDVQGALIGTTLDYTNQLGPNLTWTFRAACTLTNAASAKVVNVLAR